MSATELTAIITAITALLGGPGFLAYINHRRRTPSVTSVAKMFKEERDRLQDKLDKMNEERDQKIAAVQASGTAALEKVEAKWRRQHEEDQAQIRQLRTEIDSLYRRLYQPPPGP